MTKTIVRSQRRWNAQQGCEEETELYWEDGFIHDLEWLDEECYILRVDMSLWIETSRFDKMEDGSLVLRSRTRTRQMTYVLAERYCRMDVYKVWTDKSELEPVTEKWDLEGGFWR